jgi:hypothetical protein
VSRDSFFSLFPFVPVDGLLLSMKILYPLSIIAAAGCSAFACHTSLFFGWLTATPLSDVQRARAEYNAYAWFAIFVACWAVVFGAAVCWFRSRGQKSGTEPRRQELN